MNIFSVGIVSVMLSVSAGTATIINTDLDEKINMIIQDLKAEDKSKLSASMDRLSNSFNKLSENEEFQQELNKMLALENADREDRRKLIAQQLASAFEGNGEKPASLDDIIDSSIDVNRELEEVAEIKEDILVATKKYL